MISMLLAGSRHKVPAVRLFRACVCAKDCQNDSTRKPIGSVADYRSGAVSGLDQVPQSSIDCVRRVGININIIVARITPLITNNELLSAKSRSPAQRIRDGRGAVGMRSDVVVGITQAGAAAHRSPLYRVRRFCLVEDCLVGSAKGIIV